ncbi:hypothetical protein LTR84_000051 [Exophiala bonariae]|uniref:Uncharacterized protein n=1 Tax=Exophiala bonariae TaxID=1690606 RepID=A0AAV9NTJ1_9EURO|nr:hypothetical protein LTR84_000051 [Exophiala bonariae]
MPEEQWRDELQEYALLVEAVSSGDRSKVVKLFGDYILRKKAAEAIEEAEAEIEAEAAVENEYVDEEDNQRDLNEDDHEEGLDSGEAYEEDYTAEDYENHYDEDEPGAHERTPGKRVTFADDEGGGGEDEEEYYDDEGNPLYDDQGNGYGDPDNGYYEEEYNPDGYVGGEKTIPYMSGALSSEHNESNEYDQGTYGEGFDYDDNTQSYDQGDQFENANIQDMGHQEQYQDYYGSSNVAGGYEGNGYHDSAQVEGFYDYDVNQQDGGEWSSAVNENERVTDDEVQDNGMNNNNYEFDNSYNEEVPNFQADELNELNGLMNRLQLTMNAHEYDGGEERQGQDYAENGYPEYELGVHKGNSTGLGDTHQQSPYPDHEEESVRKRSIAVLPPYADNEEGRSSNNPSSAQPRDLVYEESIDDKDIDDFDFWDDGPANQANVQGCLEDLDWVQEQLWDDSLNKDLSRRRDNIALDNEDLEEYDEDYNDEEGYDEGNHDGNSLSQTDSTERVWVDSVRPHYDADTAPFPGFHRTISNDQVLPYAILPGDRFDTNMRRDPIEEVNPTYNVFDTGQRFYDHYSDNREDRKRDPKRRNQRGTLHPMSLVDKFRERLYAN